MMRDDDLRRALKLHDQLQLHAKLINRHLAALKQAGQFSVIERFTEDARRREALVKAALGPIASLGSSRLDQLIPRLPALDEATRLIAASEERFRLPALEEAAKLSERLL